MTPATDYRRDEGGDILADMVATVPFTRSDYDSLPEGFRVELIDGELLKMASPTMFHQELVLRIANALQLTTPPRTVFVGPVDFVIDDANVLVPDVVALPEPPQPGAEHTTVALLVVEILSPSTAARDRRIKARKYMDAGVEEVWLVDPKGATVELIQPRQSRTLAGTETAQSRVVPGFALVPAELF